MCDLCFQVLDKPAIGIREGDIHIDAPPRRRLQHMEEVTRAPSLLARPMAYANAWLASLKSRGTKTRAVIMVSFLSEVSFPPLAQAVFP